jgi:hypothetical protein
VVSVTFAHLGANGWVGQVEVANGLESADMNAESTVVCVPDELRTVDAVVGPVESEAVRPTFEL